MTEGYLVKDYGQPVRRFVQTMQLHADDELIRKYVEAHSQPFFWSEIGEGIRQVGILDMQIFLQGNVLVMIVDAPANFQWEDAMAKLAQFPRQQEWEDHVAQFQDCESGSTSNEKWKMMSRIFHLYE